MKTIIGKCREIINEKLNDVVPIFRENMAFLGEMCFISALNEKAKVIGVLDNCHLLVEINNETKEIFTGEVVCI
jgi:hypothetical protein